MDNVTSQDVADTTPAPSPTERADKLFIYLKNISEMRLDLSRVYPVESFINEFTNKLKQGTANYIRLNVNSREDASEVYVDFISGREETDEEFDERMLREKWTADNLILSQYKADYIQYLSLKAKFE